MHNFGLTCPRQSERPRGLLFHADAYREESTSVSSSGKVAHGGAGKPDTWRAQRMTKCTEAAVGFHGPGVVRQTQEPSDRKGLSGPCPLPDDGGNTTTTAP